MSTITVSNIKATGETASRAVSGVAAAWVNFNGTGTVAIRDSQGVSGLVDDGVGQFTFTFTNSMNNSNYSVTATSGSSNSWSSTEFIGAYSTGSFKIETGATNSSARNDWVDNNCAIHGDLA